MYSNMKNAAILLAFAAASNAQTWSDCNPVEGDKCDPNPAVGTEESLDFQKLSKISDIEGVFTVDGGIKYDENWDQLSFDPETGMKMSINEEKHAPTLYSKNYIFFGHVEVELRAAPGAGIITSIVLQSDSLDEIDWEFVGNDQSHVQTNFFHKGIEDYGYGEEHEIATNPMENFHTYAIDWTPEAMVFSIDGQVVREAFPDTGVFPQTPCQLRIGTWVGGKGDEEKQAGTIEWAGGMAQWDKAPFDAYYRRIQIVDYAGGYEGAKQYEYSNTNGTWESIRVVGGKQVGFPDSDFPPVNNHEMAEESSTSASPSTSATITPSLASSAASVVSSVLAEVSSAVSSAAAEESSSAIESSSVYSESLTTTTTTSASVSTVASSTPSPTSDGAEAEESGDAEAGASTLQKSGLALGVAALFAIMM